MKEIIKTFNPYAIIEKNKLAHKKECIADDEKNEAIINEIYSSIKAALPEAFIPHRQEDIDAYKKQLFLALKENNIISHESIERCLKEARASTLKSLPNTSTVVSWCQGVPEKTIKPTSNTMDWNLLENWKAKTGEEKERNSKIRESEMAKMRRSLR